MAYLQGFENDVFISYAHRDDEPMPDLGRSLGWVSQFHKRLKWGLDRAVGHEVTIWLDELSLRRSESFDDRIQHALDGAAFLVVVTSRTSIHSEYCAKEIRRFAARARCDPFQPRLGANGSGPRILHVLLDDIEPPEWPAEVQGTNAFNFYATNAAGKVVGPLVYGSGPYNEQIDKLTVELGELLREARGLRPRPRRPILRHAILLAAVEPLEDQPLRDRLEDALGKRGMEVLDAAAPNAADGVMTVDALAARAAVSVHVLGPQRYAPAIDQFLACQEARLAQVVWVPKDVVLPDAPYGYLAWLREIERSKRSPDHFTFIHGAPSRAVAEIVEAVEEFCPPPAPKYPAIVLQAHKAHKVDEDLAYEAYIHLREQKTSARLDTYADDGPSRSRFEQMMRDAKGLVVFFGEVNRDWVEHRVQEAVKVRRPDPLKVVGVCLAPPPKPDDSNHRPSDVDQPSVPRMTFVDNSQGFDPAPWNTLAEVIR